MQVVTETTKGQIRAEWEAAPYGSKSGIIRRWASVSGCSYQTLYRQLQIGRKRTGQRKISGLDEAAKAVADIKKKLPRIGGGKLTTNQAIRVAVSSGLIPEEMGTVSTSTFNRAIRQIRLTRKVSRKKRK